MKARSVFELWRQLYDAQAAWAASRALPPLLANFGVSLIERAVIDAVCRAAGRPFSNLLRSNVFQISLAELHPELAGTELASLLPPQPLARVIVRHTVGLADPLTEAEIPESERLHDGLPQSLEAASRRYGLRHFKIKVKGRLAEDKDRLSAVARVLRETACPTYRFSLDGNEQFSSINQFRDFWREMTGHAALREFFEHLLFIEQPLNRDRALNPGIRDEFVNWQDRPPIIIDESDGDLHALPTALQLGYAGASHKNCKGVFKSLANYALISAHRMHTGRHAFMTGEDLCNIGPVALQQDLAVMAALGISSIERNGHHYHRGLSQFPPAVQRLVLAAHPELYEATSAGWPTLRINEGELSLESISAAPFGSVFRSEDCALLQG
jgi:L-alanine-DL-glutamate epimerase-like enolase superfamily enzyme